MRTESIHRIPFARWTALYRTLDPETLVTGALALRVKAGGRGLAFRRSIEAALVQRGTRTESVQPLVEASLSFTGSRFHTLPTFVVSWSVTGQWLVVARVTRLLA